VEEPVTSGVGSTEPPGSGVWRELERPGRDSIDLGGVEVRRGSRVRLRPRVRRDAWDTLLAGKDAVVERVEEDLEGAVHVVVSLADDPGRELGGEHPGHAFFFAPDELEPHVGARILVAGIGNVFLGDDGFGSAVAAALADAPLPNGVEVADFGIRGMDLAYALRDYDAAVLVDAAPLGEAPGTLAVVEPELDRGEAEIETHAMDPVRVLRLARELEGLPRRTLVVACEPETIPDPTGEEIVGELSAPVRAAVAEAVELVRTLTVELLEETTKGGAR
jgi:hydrogenase maturation protease